MVILRGLEERDKEQIYIWISNPELRKMTGTRGKPNIENHAIWFSNKLRDKLNHIRMIEVEGKSVGIIGTNTMDNENRSADIFIYIGEEEQRNKGIASQAIKLFSNFLFKECSCHKITASVRSYNEPSICLFQKNGFVCEGIQKEQVLFEGQYYDRFLFGMINNA